jgi:putative PIN family toxin of toxin-antitoxin system
VKVLLDTNVLVSAALFPGGIAAQAYDLAISADFVPVVPRYALDELRDVCRRKFPSRLEQVGRFIATLPEIVEITETATGDEQAIRDPKDWPVWQAARATDADVLVTGDKDFLESGLPDPRIVSPSGFLAAYAARNCPRIEPQQTRSNRVHSGGRDGRFPLSNQETAVGQRFPEATGKLRMLDGVAASR